MVALVAAACLAGCVCEPSMVRAQTLRLDSGPAMPAGRRYALEREILSLASLVKELETQVKSSGQGAEKSVADEKLRFRQCSLALLEQGAVLGDAGWAQVMAGLTLKRSIPMFDELCGKQANAGAARAAEFHRLVMLLPRDKGEIPGGLDDLDRFLAQRLAPIAMLHEPRGSAAQCGWIEDPAYDPDKLGASLKALESDPAVTQNLTPAIRAACKSFGEKFESGGLAFGTAHAHCVAADAIVRSVTACAGIPQWVPPALKESLIRRLDRALADAATNPTSIAAVTELARISRSAETTRRVEKPRAVNARLMKSMRELTLRTIGGGKDEKLTPEGADTTLRILNAALDELDRSDAITPQHERGLVREARAVWRLVWPQLRRAEEGVLAAAEKVAKSGGGATDPAYIAAVGALRSVTQDLDGVRRISWWLEGNSDGGLSPALVPDAPTTPGTPTPPMKPAPRLADDKQRKQAATRLLKLAQAMGKSESRDAAQEAVRVFGSALELLAPMQGESELREAIGGGSQIEVWGNLTDKRAAEVAAKLDAARTDLVYSWSSLAGDPLDVSTTAGARGELDRWRELLLVLRDAAATDALVGSAAVSTTSPADAQAFFNDWPGWELSSSAAASASRGVADRVVISVKHVLDRDHAAADKSLGEIRDDFGLVRLLAELARAHRVGHGVASFPLAEFAEAPLAAPVSARALGYPSPWLLAERATLGAICWMAMEHEAAIAMAAKEPDRKKKDELEKYVAALRRGVNVSSADVLKRVGSERGR